MKYMSLFAPSPYSYYRVQVFAEVEEADHFCQMGDAIPSMYVRLMAYEIIKRPNTTRKANRDRDKYMVLWLDMSDCCYLMREFELREEAIAFASSQTAKLQTPPGKFGHGIARYACSVLRPYENGMCRRSPQDGWEIYGRWKKEEQEQSMENGQKDGNLFNSLRAAVHFVSSEQLPLLGSAHFFPALTLAHRARAAALIRASPAAEM
jgi:hypothetical protein